MKTNTLLHTIVAGLGLVHLTAATGPYLGISAGPVDPVLAQHLDLPAGMGLQVRYVDPQGAAAGLLRTGYGKNETPEGAPPTGVLYVPARRGAWRGPFELNLVGSTSGPPLTRNRAGPANAGRRWMRNGGYEVSGS